VVLLGVAHRGCVHRFAATRQSYATPLGTLPTDTALVDRLATRLPFDLLAGELAHRSEHSIELQAIWLRHLLGEVPTLPVLCGGMHDPLVRGESPADDPESHVFLVALGEELAAAGGHTLIVAGIDLSHVGPQFGDARPLAAADLEAVEDIDRSLLAAAAVRDPERLFAAWRRSRDASHVCGHAALYAAVALLGSGPQGAVQAYRQWTAPAGQGAVTFAAVTFAAA